MDKKDLRRFKDKLLEAKEAVIRRVQKAEDYGREASEKGEKGEATRQGDRIKKRGHVPISEARKAWAEV